MKYHHFTRNGKQYKLPKKSLLGFMYSHSDAVCTALEAIGYTLAFPLAALPFFLPVLIGLLFM